jgi:magnesium-transporting ATPase (P-type)
VAERQQQFGLNVLSPPKSQGPLLRLLLQFHQPLVHIFLAAAAVTTIFGEFVDCLVILGVVLLNATIEFFQEAKALRTIEALGKTEATVLRDG